MRQSRSTLMVGILALAFFACMFYVSYHVCDAVVTSATFGNRELPIYSVDTAEKKVALSFDAAWGAVRSMKNAGERLGRKEVCEGSSMRGENVLY